MYLANIFGIEPMLVVLLIVLVLFGGKKIPELLRGVGRGVGELHKGLHEGKQQFEQAVHEPTPSSFPTETQPVVTTPVEAQPRQAAKSSAPETPA